MRSDLSTLLVRHAMYPLHEWLAGRDTLSELDRISAAARLPTSQAQRALSQRIRRTLRRAARTEYYARLFATLGVDPGSARPEAELQKLPLLGKSVVRANLERMTRFDTPGGAIASQSGGASGDTLRFYTDRRAQAANLAARLFMQSLFGVALGARRAYVWGSPIETRGARRKRWRDRLLNEVMLDAFEMSEPQMAAHLERLAAFRPQVIYGYPSAVARLAQFAEQTGHAAWPCRGNHTAAAQRGGGARESTGPLLVVLTGEEASAAQIEAARRVFGGAVAQEYGSRETGIIAHECPAGSLHVLSPNVLVEAAPFEPQPNEPRLKAPQTAPVPSDAEVPRYCGPQAPSPAIRRTWKSDATALLQMPVSAKEQARAPAVHAPAVHTLLAPPGSGEIVCTTLAAHAQPLLRYRVGDAGALLDGPCACGLSLPRMRLDGGKITGLIVAPDGRLCHGAVTSHVLRDEPGIKQFKTWQRSTRRFEIALVVDASYDPAAAGRIRDRYRRLFGPEVEVECKIVDRIPPDPSGKRRYVVSEVVEALG